jgi:hypothetical protein
MAHELSHVVAGRGHAPVLARVALTPADFDELADSIHRAVGSPASDEELIYVALQKLECDATAIASMTSAYKKRFKAELLSDLGTRLKGHGLGLAKTLLGEKKGLAIAAAPPSRPAEFESIARAVNAALVAKTIDAEGVYAALIPLGRNAGLVATLKTTYSKLFTTDLEADLTAKLAGADRSYALYLLDAPGAASAHSPPSVAYVALPGFGASPTTATVGGGTVSARTTVPYSYQPKDPKKPETPSQFGFGCGYTGTLSSDTRWLQFIEREIDATEGGVTTAVPGNVTAGSRTYPLTTDVRQPSWSVDSDHASNPFFDETHADTSWRDATSVSAYDAPSPTRKHANERFEKHGATLVTAHAFRHLSDPGLRTDLPRRDRAGLDVHGPRQVHDDPHGEVAGRGHEPAGPPEESLGRALPSVRVHPVAGPLGKQIEKQIEPRGREEIIAMGEALHDQHQAELAAVGKEITPRRSRHRTLPGRLRGRHPARRHLRPARPASWRQDRRAARPRTRASSGDGDSRHPGI